MNDVVRPLASTGGPPHLHANRVARQRQTLPQPEREERQRLEQPTPAAHPGREREPRDANAGVIFYSGGQTPPGRRPEGFEIKCVGRPNFYGVALSDEESAQPAKIRLRTAQGRRISLDEVGHPHGRPLAGELARSRKTAGYHNRSAVLNATWRPSTT